MAVCRFFLEGRCKYGDRCFNEHPRGNGPAMGGGGGRGVTFRDSFGTSGQQNQNPYRWAATAQPQQQQPQPASSSSVQDIIKSLPKEMEVWQASKMWPFSCFSIEKEIPSLPDFVDMSPEELRLDAYNAINQGTVDSYKQKVMQLMQEYRRKQDQIKAMPPALRQKLTELLDEGRRQKAAKASGQSLVRPSTFAGGQSGGGLFGSGGGSSSVFGSNAPTASASPSSVFGSSAAAGTGSVFGSSGTTSTGSVFGNSSAPGSTFGAAATQASSVFGQSSVFGAQPATGSTSLFGQTQPAPGLFGKGAVAATAPTSTVGGGGVFGQTAPAPGLFAQPTNTTTTNPPAGLFGKPAAPGPGIFGQSPSSGGGFGQNASAGSIFGQAPASSGGSVFSPAAASTAAPAPGLFGSNPSMSSVFGASGAASQPTQGLFGKGVPGGAAQAGGGSVFGGGATASQIPNDSTLYTPLADLTEQEKAQFEAQTFTLGLIPMRPPPRELIN